MSTSNLIIGIIIGLIGGAVIGASLAYLLAQNGQTDALIKARREGVEAEAKRWADFWQMHRCSAIKKNGEQCGFALINGRCNVHALPVDVESGDPTDVAPR